MTAAIRSSLYLLIAFASAALVLAGFSRTFYLRPLFGLEPLSFLLHVHGAAFTAWLALFIIQAKLVAARRLDWHRRLGMAGGVIAVVMVLTSAASIVNAMRGGRIIGGMPAWQFMALTSISITLFAAFVIAALALRRRPDWHRRFMTVATLGILGPGVGRLLMLIAGPPAARYANWVLAFLLLACLAHDWLRYRIVHPAFAIGTTVLLGAIPLKQLLAHSAAWAQFSRWIMAG